MAVKLNLQDHFSGKRTCSVQKSRHDSQLLPQESVIIAEQHRWCEKLGEGSYAKILIGKYLGKDRAVKVFKTGISSFEMVKEEFGRLNSFKHPNIVHVYGMWEDTVKGKSAFAIVMELCEGSLRKFIEQSSSKGISSEHKLKILHDITCAMVYLHSQSVVYGNLRSTHVLMKRNNGVVTGKLIDFRTARVLDASANAHYSASPIDNDYLPPEVYNHDEYKNASKAYARLTRQVDVFYFGPITIELTCGQVPKPGPKEEKKKGAVVKTYTEVERRKKHLLMIKPDDHMYVDLIVKRCMADNPADRASFEELQLIVERFQKKDDKRPDKELMEEKQREVEYLKSALEANQVTLTDECLEKKAAYFEKSSLTFDQNAADQEKNTKRVQRQLDSSEQENKALKKKLKAILNQHDLKETQTELEQQLSASKEELKAAQHELKETQTKLEQQLSDQGEKAGNESPKFPFKRPNRNNHTDADQRNQVNQTAARQHCCDEYFRKVTEPRLNQFQDAQSKLREDIQHIQRQLQLDTSHQQYSQPSLSSSPPPPARDSHGIARNRRKSSTGPQSLQACLESVDPNLLQQTPTLRDLMPYIPGLAAKGSQIAGYLNMQKEWDSLASAHLEVGVWLQKLFSIWLEGEENSETPHNWKFFISLVQGKGIDQHTVAKKICSDLNTKVPAPNDTSLSSGSSYPQL